MVDKGAFPARKRLNEEETMALAYLLSPTFQFVNTAGRPLTGGYLEVYIAGSREKYYCASDFNGTLHPFRIPLDSLGASVVLADDGHSYDVYAYNRYGGLSMSRYNVSPGGGGISSGSITSTDGSIVITQTQGGVDLRVNLEAPTVMRCSAEDLTSDGSFQFTQVQRDGQGARVVSHNVNIDKGWWHYDATVRIRWQGSAESTQQVGLYSSNGSDTMDFDLSYPHSETVRLSGEYKAVENGTTFTIGFTGIVAGMTASLVDFGIHTITNGSGAGGQYYAGDGIEVNESDRIISAKVDGTTIDTNDNGELEVIGGQELYVVTHEPGGSFPASLFDDAYAAYQAGKTLVYVEGERRGMFIGYYSPYGLMFALDVVNLSDSAPTDADGFIDFVWLYRSDVGSPHSGWRHTSLNLVPMHRQEDAGKVLTVDTEHPLNTPVWTSLPNFSDFVTDTELSTILEGYQTALSAGANIQINNGTISATDTTYSAGTGLNLSGTEFSVDTSEIQEKLTAGSNIVIEGNTISATAEPQLQANWAEDSTSSVQYIQNKPDLSVYATTSAMNTALAGKQDTISDLSDIRAGAQAGSTAVQPAALNDYATTSAMNTALAGKQDVLTAGSNISISGSTISATDTTYSAGSGLDLTGTEFSVDTNTVALKSDLPIQQQLVPGYSLPADEGKVLTAGSTTYWSSLSDYVTDTELSTILQGYQEALTAGSNIQISNGTISATDTTYNAGSGLDLTGTTFSVDTSTIATKADLAAYTPTASLGAVALSNDYDDLSNKPTIPVVPDMKSLVAGDNVSITEDATTVTISASGAPQLQANWNEQDSSSVQYIQNKPTIPVLPSTKDLVAGSNITITESSNDVTVACSITVGTVTI